MLVKCLILKTFSFISSKDVKMSANTSDKIRVDTPSDRKTVKEVPSDPRRRRRTSESSSHAPQSKENQATTPKKSPRNDEPSTKLRRTGSRGSLNSLTR